MTNYHTMLVNLPRILVFGRQRMSRDIIVHGLDLLAQAITKRRGVLLLGGHVGDWLMLPVAACLLDGSVGDKVVVIPGHRFGINNFGWFVRLVRRRVNIQLLPIRSTGSLLSVVKSLKRGGMVGILADLTRPGESELTTVDIGWSQAEMSDGADRIARLSGAEVLVVTCFRRDDGLYDVFVRPMPKEREDQGGLGRPFMQLYADTLGLKTTPRELIYRFGDSNRLVQRACAAIKRRLVNAGGQLT